MRLLWKFFLDTLLMFCCNCVWCIKNVMIEIDPPVVERGASATLRCNYDLEGEPLYTVKWYRGQREFYRYTLNEVPPTKVFLFEGLKVNLEMSDEHQVVLQNVEFNLSGNFTCEVSADGPSFPTDMVSRNMSVVVIPKHPPTITTDKSEYTVGDVVRANCTSSPSKPGATLTFSLNNMVVPTHSERKIPVARGLWVTWASTEFKLFHSNFLDGSLYLHCLAQVTDLYQHDTPFLLDNLKDPVPARVTSQNRGSSHKLAIVPIVLQMSLLLM
ncbi:hypothetical protein PPYR_06109 [Photinus pyralis]|uniref:Ig-like domain-containing protein n=1 Tax=Photinus pyralis TaxID=7054 RepID=A0A5N4AST3_PHOPY|nr:uncharacterized protein LOC116167436 isoform X1 [Photinus pyralis]KAB0800369.1 hypothetical protein PPYR_06109 [Photinus pyralis]